METILKPVQETIAAPASPPQYDLRDWVTLVLIGAGFAASWVYVFIHPSVEAFGICVGAVGTFGAAFHWLCVRDDKTPDRKDCP
jgi:hypothetical protein